MAQYYSGKEVQQPYDTARESVEALNTTAGKGIKQARTSTRNIIDRVKQTASDFTDPHRTILPTPGSFVYQRDGEGNILYGEDGKPVSVRDYKRAGIKHFAENQNKAGDPRQAAISYIRNMIENNTLPDQTVGPMQKTVFELENSMALDQEGTVDITYFNQQNKDYLTEDTSKQIEENRNKLQSGAGVDLKIEEEENKGKQVESQFELKGGPLKSEAQAREEWLEKTRNSPAQQSGAWAGKEGELWEQSKKSGANKGREFAEAIKKPEVKSEDLLNKMKKR